MPPSVVDLRNAVQSALAERTFSTEQRERMARSGQALPDGSFPIGNEEDLRNAISAYGRASNKAAAKRHIIKRARALGKTSLLPDDWAVQESASMKSLMERALEALGLRQVAEAAPPRGEKLTPGEWMQVAHAALEEASKAEANYDATGGTAARSCANCSAFNGTNGCSLVSGVIAPGGISDLWRAATTEALVDEPAQPEGTEPLLESAVPLMEKALRTDGSFPVKLIDAGWGTSGYYSKELLKKAAEAGRFPRGLKMFWNHPTDAEAAARPERDLRDLAARTVSAGVYQENGPDGPGVYATAQAYGHYAPHIEELAADIGVSIRGFGRTTQGEAEGQKGALVEDIAAVQSADFVTQAGRGGRVLPLMEAARLKASAAVEPPKEDADMGDQLQESAALQEKDTLIESQKATIGSLVERLVLREAGDVIKEALNASKLPDITKKRLLEQLIANPPTKEVDGVTTLDADKFKESIDAAIKAAASEIAAITGAGNVAGLGEGEDHAAPQTDEQLKESHDAMVEAFVSMGYSKEAAESAAAGRVN